MITYYVHKEVLFIQAELHSFIFYLKRKS